MTTPSDLTLNQKQIIHTKQIILKHFLIRFSFVFPEEEHLKYPKRLNPSTDPPPFLMGQEISFGPKPI